MTDPPLLFPQTIPYPKKVEGALRSFESFSVLSLASTEEIWRSHWPELFPRAKFLKFKGEKTPDFSYLKGIFNQLKDWARSFRDLTTLWIYELSKAAEEEGLFPVTGTKKTSFNKIEEAILNLMLAEDLDLTLAEVNKNLQNFEATWSNFFKEAILGPDPTVTHLKTYLEDLKSEVPLLNLSRRIESWMVIFPWLDLSPQRKMVLIVSEKDTLDWLKDLCWPDFATFIDVIPLF